MLSTDDIDNIVHHVFDKFSSIPNEMDVNDFKKLVRDLNIHQRKFTVSDAEMLFRRSLVQIETQSDISLKNGIISGKRINFTVFRNVILPSTARARGTGVDDFVIILRKNMISSGENSAEVAVSSK